MANILSSAGTQVGLMNHSRLTTLNTNLESKVAMIAAKLDELEHDEIVRESDLERDELVEATGDVLPR